MSNPNLIITLAKVIIAAAWADGEVQIEEINSLKDLLFRLPDITGREWAMLEMYMDSPVGEEERAQLVDQLRAELRSRTDRELALSALDDLVGADGVVTEDEKEVAKEIRAAIESADVGIFKQVSALFRGPVQRRQLVTAGAINRENNFEDYIKNKVYYGINRQLDIGEAELNIPEDELRKLSLAGGLMARVALVDREVVDSEVEAMISILVRDWGLTRDQAAFVSQVAVSEITSSMDYYRLTRQFFINTTEEERVRFLDVLFAVAEADDYVSSEEIEEIRALTRALKLSHRHFIDAKLKIPRDRRAS